MLGKIICYLLGIITLLALFSPSDDSDDDFNEPPI